MVSALAPQSGDPPGNKTRGDGSKRFTMRSEPDLTSTVLHRMSIASGRLTAPHQTPTRTALTEQEIAAELGLSVSWVQHDRTGKRLLPYYRIGGRIRYNLARVLQALAAMEEGGLAA